MTDLNDSLAVKLLGWRRVVLGTQPQGEREPRGWRTPEGRERSILPDLSGSWEGMERIVEAMKERGYSSEFGYTEEGNPYASFGRGDTMWGSGGDTIPMAAATAAQGALEARE